jgi:hypothetical protein
VSGRGYFWLFVGLWVAAAGAIWAAGDWNAYYDRGHGSEVKFTLSLWLQFAISATLGAFAAAFVTAVAYLIPARRSN